MADYIETRVEDHPAIADPDSPIKGGRFHFFDLDNGTHVRVLDTEWDWADDLELHQLDDDGNVIPSTERRGKNWAAIQKIMADLDGK